MDSSGRRPGDGIQGHLGRCDSGRAEGPGHTFRGARRDGPRIEAGDGARAIFPIASMSKPITGVAILMLVEEGKIRLTDPVSRFVPEFKDTKVAILKAGGRTSSPTAPGQPPRAPEIYTVPAARRRSPSAILTHTSGLASGGAGSREASRVAPRRTTESLATYIPTLGVAPLDFQPGSEWAYSALAGIEVLGRIVEVASGLNFDQFLRQRLFEPLGMKDTAFYPTADRTPRVVTLYERTPSGLGRIDVPGWLATRTLFSGGGGLWSTAEDYLQFAQMLVNGGELNGRRILAPRTVERMASNHVGDSFSSSGRTGGREGMGFGLTVEVVLDAVAASDPRSTGSFGWGGAFGTFFRVASQGGSGGRPHGADARRNPARRGFPERRDAGRRRLAHGVIP